MATTNSQNDLEFALLRTFLAVTRYGSMGRAAAAIHRTQPAVSQQMSRLEKIIGNRVFSRTRGGVRLTRHGETLVHYANRALELNEEALARLREEVLLGPLRLGVSQDAALAILIPALKRFQSSNSNLLLEISVAGSSKLNFLLRKGELDLQLALRTWWTRRLLCNGRHGRRGSQAPPCRSIPSGHCRWCYGRVQVFGMTVFWIRCAGRVPNRESS